MTHTAPTSPADFDQLIMARFAGQRGWFCLGHIDLDPDIEDLKQEWYSWPRQRRDLADRCAALASRGYNLYWAECLFSGRKRSYKNALPSAWLWIDDAPEDIVCTELIQTSEHSYQARNRLDRSITAEERSRLQVAWRDSVGADACSKDAVHMGRMPGGYNRKRHGKYLVTVVRRSDLILSADYYLAKYPPRPEQHGGAGEITPLNRPEIEKHLANIEALLTSGRANAIKPETQTGRILAGERVAIASKRFGRMDDSGSAQGAILAYGFYCRGFMDDEIGAVNLHFYREWGIEARKGTAWCIADIERCIALAKAKKPGVVQSPTRYKAAQVAAPLVETPAPSRARHDRPTKLDAPMLLSRYQQQPHLCELKRKARAARLEISTATLDRLEDALEARDLIQIEAQPGLPGRVILRGVINIPEPEVLSAPIEERADSGVPVAQNGDRDPQCIGETHPPPGAPRPPAAPPALVDAIRWAIVAMEKQAVNPETGEMWKGRANPDRVRGWIAEHYPTLETVELEALYPQVRKQVQAQRAARKQRDFWDGERRRIGALEDEPLIVALWGAASRMQAAVAKRPGSPWAKRCAALFAIHDDERRRRGLSAGDGPPPATDRTSRKTAKARMQALASVVNAEPSRSTEDSTPAQIGFASLSGQASEEDLIWMREHALAKPKRRRPAAGHQVEPAAQQGLSAVVCSPQSPPAAAGTLSSLLAGIRQYHERQTAAPQ